MQPTRAQTRVWKNHRPLIPRFEAQHKRRVRLHGFALSGVYPATSFARGAVCSYHTLSPLPFQQLKRRFPFCGTFPQVSLAGRYPAPFFHKARTFLTQIHTKKTPTRGPSTF